MPKLTSIEGTLFIYPNLQNAKEFAEATENILRLADNVSTAGVHRSLIRERQGRFILCILRGLLFKWMKKVF